MNLPKDATNLITATRQLVCAGHPRFTKDVRAFVLLVWFGMFAVNAGAETLLGLQTTTASTRVSVGKSVAVTVVAIRAGQPVSGQELWAYLDGKQWGAQAITDAAGKAMFLLPLPRVGNARIQVAPPPAGFAWPTKTFGQTADFTVGTPLPSGSVASDPLTVEVTPRRFAPTRDPNHLVGTPWYPWFTRYNAHVNGGHSEAESVPLLGSYASDNPDVIRQQMLWLDEVGVNFVQVDWSNNLGNSLHWKDHPPGVDEMIGSTRALLDTLAQMRCEGLPTPQVLLLLGIAPPFSLVALNEEMAFVHDTFLTDPRYAGLFVTYLDKPLTTVLSVLPDAELAKRGPVDSTHFTIRWEWVGVADRPGWWSWTDPYLPPTTAYFDGHAESLSVASAYSAGTGWNDPKSLGKGGGSTWVRGFQEAMKTRPAFLFLQQFNEWGEQADTERSNDFEPCVLSSLGRGLTGHEGGAGPGWGYHELNLARALVALYHGEAPETTVLTVAAPLHGAIVSGPTLNAEWQSIGKPAASYSVSLDGTVKASGLPGDAYSLTLSGLPPGPHTLTVTAEGTVTRFSLSRETDDEPTDRPTDCSVSVPFTVP